LKHNPPTGSPFPANDLPKAIFSITPGISSIAAFIPPHFQARPAKSTHPASIRLPQFHATPKPDSGWSIRRKGFFAV
jgi:hypothetical protein